LSYSYMQVTAMVDLEAAGGNEPAPPLVI
jgi:hypothetical protein